MENEDKHTISDAVAPHQITIYSSTTPSDDHRRDAKPTSPPAMSPIYSPDKSSISSNQTSLSHGFSPREDELPAKVPAKLPSPVSVVNRSVRDEPVAIKKADPGVGDGFIGGAMEEGGGGGRRLRPPFSILRRTKSVASVKKAALGFRVFGFLFCLISFSVMAADRNQGWALDSYNRYKEFRYCMSVNVIGFVYSSVQVLDVAYHLATGKYVINHQLRYYLVFAIDQMMTYLLISASSSAAVRVDDWQANWGPDKFPEMARAAVGMSFMAFVALAFSSLISGYALFTFRYS